MDAAELTGDWGDPYVGLAEAARRVGELTQICLSTPRLALAGMRSALGSPSIWDDIVSTLQWLASLLSPWNLFAWLNSMVVQPLRDWLKWDLLSGFNSFLTDQVRLVMGWFSSLFDRIRDGLREPIAWVNGTISGLGDWLRNSLGSIVANLRDGLWASYNWLVGGVGPLLSGVRDALLGVWYWVSGTLGPTVGAIRDALLGVQSWVISTVGPVVLGLRDAALGVYHWARDTLWTVLLGMREAISGTWDWLSHRLGPWLGDMPRTIWSGLSSWTAQVWAGFGSWLRELAAEVGGWIDSVITKGVPLVERWVSGAASLPGALLDWVAGTAGTDLAMQPGRALGTVGGMYGIALAAGTAAHLTSTATNLVPALNWVGASQLAAFVAQLAGFYPLTQATYGTLVNEALAWPLRYHWNEMLRPRMPAEGEIYQLGRKRALDRQEFYQAMARQGLPDWWIERMYQQFWTDPSPMWLLRMAEVGIPPMRPSETFLPWLDKWMPDWRADPFAWFRMKVLLAGFEDTDVPAFVTAFQQRLLTTVTGQIKSGVRAMLRAGYYTREEAEAALRPLGVRQDEIEYIMVAEELAYQQQYLGEQVQYLIDEYRKGQLDLESLRLGLSTIIMRPERVEQMVASEQVRALPTPKRVTPVTENPLVKGLVTQAVSSWTAAYRKWEISADDLEAGLTIVTRDPSLAHQLRLVEESRYRPAPPAPKPAPEDPVVAASRRAAIASWISQFRDGKISAEVLEIGLSSLIPDPERVRQLRQIEELRAPAAAGVVPAPGEDPAMAAARQQAVQAHIGMFAKRLLSIGELYAYLVADGLSEALARSTVITQAVKRLQVPPIDSPYFQRDIWQPIADEGIRAFCSAYEAGEITRDQLEQSLLGMGIDAKVVTYLADVEELKAIMRGAGQ